MSAVVEERYVQNYPASNSKYICGCGKTYTSYPAFSTHRKIKHQNINIQGTIIPKNNTSKRGRPTYQFIKKQNQYTHYKKYYQALTVIQLGILNLNSKYDHKIISEASQNTSCQFPQEFIQLCSNQKNNKETIAIEELQNEMLVPQIDHSQKFSKIILLFMNLMITHLNRRPAQALVQFFSEFGIFINENSKIDKKEGQIQIAVFNQFFKNIQKKELIDQLSYDYGLKIQFFMDITIIFSQWIFKLGLTSKVLKAKTKIESILKYKI